MVYTVGLYIFSIYVNKLLHHVSGKALIYFNKRRKRGRGDNIDHILFNKELHGLFFCFVIYKK